MTDIPSLKPCEVISALCRAGFEVVRTKGSHVILKKSPHSVTVPDHNKDIKRGTLGNIIKQAGMTVDEFLRYL
jgi:predicted RNA binding protein YcfA (HicA-like mRNA interferase family)